MLYHETRWNTLNAQDFVFPAYYVALMFVSAGNAKALGTSVVAAVGLMACNGNTELGSFIMLFYLASVVYASFRQ